jgi:nucleoside-diphosphate-sugar epimerase/phosphoglycolate phosphatase-like HAD superfamily hydrolase
LLRRYRVITLGRRPVEGVPHIRFDLAKTRRLPVSQVPENAVLVHAAALMRRSPKDDAAEERFHRINVEGTKRLLQAVRGRPPAYILYVSTTDVYADSETPIAESSRVEPMTPYAQSKLAAESAVLEFAPDAGIARLGSIYGPGEEEFEKLVPVAIRRAVLGQPVFVSGNCLRDLLFVEDAARAIETMVAQRAGGIFNIVSGKAVGILDVAKTINSLARNPAGFCNHEPRLGRDRVFARSALEALGWSPSTLLSIGLKREIAAVRRKFPLIAIDLDGTLLDHWPRMYALYREYLEARGLAPLPFSAYRKQKRAGKSEAAIAAATLPTEDVARYLSWKRARIEEWNLLSTDTPDQQEPGFFGQLFQSARVVLITGRQRPRLTRRQLRDLSLLRVFTSVVCVAGEGPDAKAGALRRLKPQWYIGDTEDDIAAARLAGVRVAAVAWGLRSAAFLREHRPDRIIRHGDRFTLLSQPV